MKKAMKNSLINFTADKRCIHLDFHTSHLVEHVGGRFSRKQFKENLQKAGIDSITLFAKCHHGCFYYEGTKFFKHPHLECSLLDEQIAVCKELGISYKIYLSAGFDEHNEELHPEWAIIHEYGDEPFKHHGDWYGCFCFNTPYLDELKAQVEEVVQRFMPDGIFLDILNYRPCYCKNCLADMERKGLDYRNIDDVMKQANDTFDHYMEVMDKAVKDIKPDCMVFQNGGDFLSGRLKFHMDKINQLEVESLPNGWWGYDHFPMSMSYIRRRGKNCIGMTGRFHKTWGDFGGNRYPEALLYEGAQSLAFDAGFSVGDQPNPSGELESFVYESIGKTNRYIKERDAWRGGEFMAEIALLSPEDNNARLGACRLLFEGKFLFDLIDEEEISNRYKLIILCSDVIHSESIYKALKTYAKNGGKILMVGSALNSSFANDLDLGCEFVAEDTQTPCYFRANYKLDVADKMPLVVYQKAYNVKAKNEQAVLANKLSPYFKRQHGMYCSHHQTPWDEEKISTGITQGQDGIYIAADLFSQYAVDGCLTEKQLIFPLIKKLLVETTVQTTLPVQGKCLLYKKGENYIYHMLYANITKKGGGIVYDECGNRMRGATIDVIEDIVTLANVQSSILCPFKPFKVIARPTGEELSFTYENGRVAFSVNNFYCYQIVEIVK